MRYYLFCMCKARGRTLRLSFKEISLFLREWNSVLKKKIDCRKYVKNYKRLYEKSRSLVAILVSYGTHPRRIITNIMFIRIDIRLETGIKVGNKHRREIKCTILLNIFYKTSYIYTAYKTILCIYFYIHTLALYDCTTITFCYMHNFTVFGGFTLILWQRTVLRFLNSLLAADCCGAPIELVGIRVFRVVFLCDI